LVVEPNLIPGFEILGRLASGGIAQVFRARRQSDGLEVALKVTSLAELDPEFRPVERFLREGSILERLNHPTLPRLHGYGVTTEAFGWMALELVKGRPLAQYRGVPIIELLPIFTQVAEALQVVAQEGVVHRDVAPDNVLVEERGARRQARLIDFGAAKDLFASGEAGSLTRHGAFLGKLAYASPEQLIGPPKGEQLDFRSDIYSLGMTMYELLSGRRAIEKETLTDVVDAHVRGVYAPLVIPEERGGPAPRLVALTLRMIARRREDRPASWEEVLAELWRAREEVSPLSDALARKRAAVLEAGGALPAEPQPVPRGGLAREELVGRVVLWIGGFAFLVTVAFAIWYVRAHRPARVAVEAVVPPPTAAAAPAVAPPPPTAVTHRPPAPEATLPPARVRAPAARPAARSGPARAASAPEEPRGVLEVAPFPGGELEEVRNESGRVVGARHPLPARLTLPPGRYRLRLASRSMDCVRTLDVVVEAGRTASVRESCIEVK